MQHLLALSLRNLDQFFSQYERFQAVRKAARINLDQQLARYNVGNVQFIVVLQAIVDWGNAVSSEAQALSQYNTELAGLELQTGTILQSHNIVFFEERFQSIGPLGRLAKDPCYPRSQPTHQAVDRYITGDQASEEYFNLEDPITLKKREFEAELPPIDLDRKLEFQKMNKDDDGEMSDEEIDALLNRPSASFLIEHMDHPFWR